MLTPPRADRANALWRGAQLAWRVPRPQVAAAIAERERQAQFAVLHSLNDRVLMDIGLNRCQIGEGLAEAAKTPIPVAAGKKQMP
jgi:uncharacterized protein YjiS (DUF1127 family)